MGAVVQLHSDSSSHHTSAQQQDQTHSTWQPDKTKQQQPNMQHDESNSKDASKLAETHSGKAAAAAMPSSHSLASLRSSSSRSVFELYPKKQKAYILATVSVASLMVPLCDTVYLPALQSIQQEFRTTQQLVAASVAVYMFTVGAASLGWGPASDRFGRKRVYLAATVAFMATSLVCVFANSIGLLIAFRALQGASVAAYGATGSGVIADVYKPQERGMALGIVTIPMLVGPILGPILGGALSQAFSWRSTFIMVAMYAALIILPMAAFMPETHQYKKLRRMHQRDPEAAAEVEEAASIFSTPPVFKAPHYPIKILCEKDIVLHAIVALLLFGSMFCSITELPLYLAAPPYNLSAAMIGLCYIPAGLASMIVSPLGGLLSDKAAAAHPGKPLVRLVYNNVISGVLMPASLLLYGWVMQAKLHLAVVLVSQFAIGVALASYLPAIFGYLTALKQSAAAAAAAGVHSGMFIMSGVLILVASAAASAIGMGPFFTLLAGLNLLTTGAAALQIFRHREASREMIRSASRAQLAAAAAAGTDEAGESTSRSSGEDVESGAGGAKA
ncbi:hypothetical protein OEZ85_007241 [Tetradesmus obliquus]|uniref:Major facilitator superfamily (MFS) profile domain-containing protein n=1 Tax=Tetradesmus obliquus TaxID=3088 RepID=A0ABY8U161_TETOB|nr:hypothetical protein OEZ85_007241 [Tetradesmus obliquus]